MKPVRIFFTIILITLLLSSTGCEIPLLKSAPTTTFTPTATSKPTLTATASATATFTPLPTFTRIPTDTPNAAATAQYTTMYDLVSGLYDDGYIPTLNGLYKHLKDFSKSWAELGWYDSFYSGASPADFVLNAHLAWESATDTPNPSGCGIVFHRQDDGQHYVVFVLTIGYVEFLMKTDHLQELGYQYFGPSNSKGEADFTLTSIGPKFDVFINQKHIKSFTGLQGKLDEGDLEFTVLSGTNADFGTKCTITGADLWVVQK